MRLAYIRCNANHETGYGHVSRCLSLAMELRKLGFECQFFLGSPDARTALENAGFYCHVLPNKDQDGKHFTDIASRTRPGLVVLDVRPALGAHAVLQLKASGCLVAAIDDISCGSLLCDVVYLPPHPAVMRAQFNDNVLARRGLSWVIIGNGLDLSDIEPAHHPFKNLLMCMGGSDPWGYTERLAPRMARACARLGMNAGVVVGPGFKDRERLMGCLRSDGVTVFDAPTNMKSVYSWADAAISTVCVGAYELAAAGRPTLYVCPDSDYAEHATVFENANLGLRIQDENEDLCSLLEKLANLGDVSPEIDSLGASRIARDMNSLLLKHAGKFSRKMATH